MWAEVDISNEEGNQVLIDLATNNWKRLDVFFANAGVIGSYSPLMVENMFFVFVRYVTHHFFVGHYPQYTTKESMRFTFDVNVIGCTLGIKLAAQGIP